MNAYALNIGINDYHPMPKLNNAVNDASAGAEALEKLGFIVNLQVDLSLDGFHSQVTNWAKI